MPHTQAMENLRTMIECVTALINDLHDAKVCENGDTLARLIDELDNACIDLQVACEEVAAHFPTNPPPTGAAGTGGSSDDGPISPTSPGL